MPMHVVEEKQLEGCLLFVLFVLQFRLALPARCIDVLPPTGRKLEELKSDAKVGMFYL